MRHDEGFLDRTSRFRLYWQRWLTDGPPRGIVVIVHGVGEHSGRYKNVAAPLVANGYSVWGYDHRGHGRSSGRRIHVDRWGDYREDLQSVLDLVAHSEPAKALFLYGHSMGALVVLDFLLHHPQRVQGAIVSGAPMEPAGVASPWQIVVARALSAWCPGFPLRLNLDSTTLSRDPAAVQAYRSDPLVTGRTTVRWGTETLAAVARVKARAAELRVPVLLIHGEADRLNLPRGSRVLRDAIAGAELQIYRGAYHEAHNDLEHMRVAEDVRQWLNRRIPTAPWRCLSSRFLLDPRCPSPTHTSDMMRRSAGSVAS